MSTVSSGLRASSLAFWRTCIFFYHNGLELTLIGVAWFVCSLPVLTVGPATLGAYTAIRELNVDSPFDRSVVEETVHDQFVPSFLLGIFPLVLGWLFFTYTANYYQTGQLLLGVFALLTGYATIYSILVLIPTFVSLARGRPVFQALREGRAWTGENPAHALLMCLTTLGVLVLSLLLTVAVALVFPGFAFTFQQDVVNSTFTAGQGT